MKRKTLSILLAVLMSMVASKSMAFSTYIDGVYYNLSGNNAIVTYSEKNTNNAYAYRGSISIPDSIVWEEKVYYVTSIGEYAFNNCNALTFIDLPGNITSIGAHAFDGCKQMTQFVVPSSCESIGTSVFDGCSSLKKIVIEDSPASLQLGYSDNGHGIHGLFYQLPLKEIYIGRDLQWPKTYNAFYDISLESVVIGEMVTSINDYMFYSCNNLRTVKIGSNVKTIGVNAFLFSGIMNISIPDNVTSIGKNAFSKCDSLEEITLGRGVKSVGEGMLSGCEKLMNIYCYPTLPPSYSSNSSLCYNYNTTILHVPSSSLTRYQLTSPWSKFKNIVALIISAESLQLAEHNYTLSVGERKKVPYSMSPNDVTNRNVIWTSSDSSIVSIDNNGYLVGVSQGQTWVKATAESNLEAVDSCFVTVVQPVTGVTLSHTEYALNGIGKTVQLEASVQPNDATNKGVTWSSSNESVCTVKDGLVTAKGKGAAIISVKTDDGGFTASCTVTVTQAVTGITLNYENYTLNNIGESVQLTATVTPEDADNKTVKWASLNENVCRVTNGYVLAVGEGTTIITATSADGDVSAKCTVTVKVPKAVTGVTLDKETLILHVIGESAQLTANVLPEDAGNKNVTWSTSNDAVCMVSNTGKVVATGEGSAVITVKTEDGGFTASCNVRVSISHPVTGITLNQESITFDVIGQSAQLVATVVPNEATEKGVTWSSSNESVCMVSSTGFIVAVGNGTADITATTIDGGFTATCKVKVEDITPVSSIDAEAQGYKVYDLQGRVRVRLQKGVNIIRFLDGTTKKVMIK